MRYSSQRQEQFAERGRVTVYKIVEANGYTEYAVNSPEGGIIVATRALAIDKAKQIAEKLDYAFNPRLDYTEVHKGVY